MNKNFDFSVLEMFSIIPVILDHHTGHRSINETIRRVKDKYL